MRGVINLRTEPPDQYAAFFVRQNRHIRLRAKIRNNRNERTLVGVCKLYSLNAEEESANSACALP